MRTLFCNTPYGTGGIGQHFAQLVTESRRDGCLDEYYAFSVAPGDPNGHAVSNSTYGLLTYTPVRFFPAWRSHLANEIFDRRVAGMLPPPTENSENRTLMGFAGSSLQTFRTGRAYGFDRLELIAPNSHVENVSRLHARAAADSGIRDTWLNDTQKRKTLREYELADFIYVNSEYVRQSFLDAGIPASKLRRTVLTVASRFVPPRSRPDDGTFRIVYVGRVDATKGLPLLLDAFHRLPFKAELTIVGRWATRQMRRYMEARCRRNPRILIAPGDPLPALQAADVYVHPTYEDGFGYAPMEALACGTPVIVTADTGMKEYLEEGRNGYIIPTGNEEALLDRLVHLRRHPLSRVDFPDAVSLS